jgi:hypothetical protein
MSEENDNRKPEAERRLALVSLLACPFCGYDSAKSHGPQLLNWTAQNGRIYHAVRCNCDVMQSDSLESVQGWTYPDEAVAAWNTRVKLCEG